MEMAKETGAVSKQEGSVVWAVGVTLRRHDMTDFRFRTLTLRGKGSIRLCRMEWQDEGLHRLKLSWKKARKLLDHAQPEQREAFNARIRALLDGARDECHHLAYLDEAHIHQDV